MRKRIKRMLSLFMVFMMVISMVSLGIIETSAYSIPSENDFLSKISSLQGRFVNGKYWNKYSSSDYSRTGDTPCTGYGLTTGVKCTSRGYCADSNGRGCSCLCGAYIENGVEKAWQCMGFAYKMGYECFGVSPYSWETSYSLGTVYAGDIIRINGDSHSIFVYKVDGSTIYYADCNRTGPCRVSWGNTYSYNELNNKFTYKKHLSGNSLTGKGAPKVTNAWVKTSKTRLATGESNTITFGADNATRYDIRIDKDGSLWKYQEGVSSGLTYTFSDAGSYSVYIAGHNSTSYMDSTKVYFTVYDTLNFGNYFYAYITNVKTGKKISANSSDNVILSSKDNSDYQKWLFERNSDGTYRITNVERQKCLDVYNADTANGTNIQVYSPNYSDAQKWYLVYNGSGYGLVPKSCSSSALDIAGGNTADGTNIQEYTWNGTASQVFSIDYISLNPTATLEYNGHRYEYYSNNITWNQAYKYCEKLGGHLVTITSKEENEVVTNLTNGYSGRAWIGSTKLNSTWYWVNGETFSYTNWSPGEPNNTNGIEDAIVIYVSGDNTGKWNDDAILNSNVEGFICEYDNIVNASDYTPVTSVESGIYIYELYDYNVDWQTAKKICEKKGGTLATIYDESENAVISNLIKNGTKNEYWIGLTDSEDEGIWRWIDGNYVPYTNWQTGEPNNDFSIEEYIAINKDSGEWYDLKGYSYFYRSIGFVCKSPIHQIGDVDGDGELNIKDATAIQMYLAGFSEINLDVADYDGDGDVNVKDATAIQMTLAGF